MDQIENALRNSNSVLRSGSSGFLLDGSVLEILPGPSLTSVPALEKSLTSPSLFPQIGNKSPTRSGTFQLPQLVPATPRSAFPPPGLPQVQSPSRRQPADSPKDTTGDLLARIAELLKTIDDMKAEKERSDADKADILKKLSVSEDLLLSKMKDLDTMGAEMEKIKKDLFYATEELSESRKSLAHAKEMWMKESARATKLRENLDKAEEDLSTRDKEAAKMTEIYRKMETENVNLKHLIKKSNEIVGPVTQAAIDNSFKESDSYFVRGGTVAQLSTTDNKNSLFTNPNMATSPANGQMGKTLQFASSTPPLTPRGTTRQTQSGSSKFLNLCLANDGILFEDEIVQIGIKAKFSGLGEGVLGVYFGNKTSGVLQSFQTRYSIETAGEMLHLTTSPIPTQLGPKSQVCQRVSAQISGPFVNAPQLVVSFLLPDNTPRTIPLRFPITINKFMQPRDISTDEFFSNWRQQLFLLNESSAVVNVAMNLAQIARVSQLGNSLKLHHQLDEVPDNLVLVGQFPSDSPEGIRCATIPEALVLLRIEVGTGANGGKARIAVRSNDALVAEAVRVCLASQLGADSP